MRTLQILSAALILSGIAGISAARADKTPELVILVMPLLGGADVVGEFVAEAPTSITLIELKSGKQKTFDRSGIRQIKRDISDAEAIAASDLSSLVAWKVNKLSASAPTLARVAKIADSTVYLTMGVKDGLTVGQKMNVFRVVGDITDPVTHKVIARERPRIAQLHITEVQDAYAKAKLIGDLEVAIKEGDEVETMPLKVSVAVVPLLDADGQETEAGVAISEDLATALVGKKVQVVERNALKSVIKEMAIQTSELIDPATVQRLGKQIGASTVLTGKIVADGNQFKAHVRLISVETGQVLMAASQIVPAKRGAVAAGEGGGTTTGGGASGSKPANGSWISLGGQNALPDYLTTKDAVNSVKDGLDLKGNKFLHTKDRNIFKGDFTFDAVCVRSAGDGILLFGIGELADADGEPPSSVKLRFHAPDLAEGYVGFNAPAKAEENIGKIRTAGTHLLRVEKKGNVVTISVYANYDGKLPANPDMSKTIPDITLFAPAIVKSGCIFLGDGVYSKVKFTQKP
jgi:TolB-like protein